MRLIPLLFLCFASHYSDGKNFGKNASPKAIDAIGKVKSADLSPEHAKPFDAKQARDQVRSGQQPQSEELIFLKSRKVRENESQTGFHPDESFLKHANQPHASENGDAIEMEESFHQCFMSGDPILITTERWIESDNVSTRVCKGHKKKVHVPFSGSYEDSIKHLKVEFENDPSIRSFHIRMIMKVLSGYVCEVSWIHNDNSPECDAFKETDTHRYGASWIYQDQAQWNLANSIDATIVEHACIETSKDGRCTRERLTFFHDVPHENNCDFLTKKHCEQIDRKCVQESQLGCSKWELTFRCFEREIRSVASDDLSFIPAETHVKEPNKSFSEVAARLSILDEAKKELEQSQAHDGTKLKIFRGEKQTCSKNVADNLLYDCCFSHSGLAKKMGLAKCNADEISLSEKRELGLCHYVGVHEKKTLGVKTSDEHVFCCFPSKIARIVQEQGRRQLHMDWGGAKEPNCSGITFEMLGKIDFSKMDLRELCEDIQTKLPDDFEKKIESFQNRLRDDLKQET